MLVTGITEEPSRCGAWLPGDGTVGHRIEFRQGDCFDPRRVTASGDRDRRACIGLTDVIVIVIRRHEAQRSRSRPEAGTPRRRKGRRKVIPREIDALPLKNRKRCEGAESIVGDDVSSEIIHCEVQGFDKIPVVAGDADPTIVARITVGPVGICGPPRTIRGGVEEGEGLEARHFDGDPP